ncbi:MAG: T9SS type A sorting domain-containing protein [Candidatus Marinimicrobia bacterium]|nr:T9SS type A sorting domain-containing protein [Candidatus Neomarinimicrobiota bacterium]
MKRIVIATLVAVLLLSSVFAVQTEILPLNYKDKVERIVKETGREIYSEQLSKATAKSAAAYDPEFTAVLIDSSKNGFGLVSGVTNPISHNGNTFVIAYRQWAGIEASSGAVGMAYSLNNGVIWSNQSNVNATSPGELTARYPSAIGAGSSLMIAWTEYTGANSGIKNDALPLFSVDETLLPYGTPYISAPQVIGNAATNPEGMWMGCPDYCEETNGTGHLNMTFTTWREFDASGDVSSHNMYLFRSNDITSGAITFQEPIKVLDALTYFEEGSADGSTTSDAMISIADNGVGYIANVAYWHTNYAGLVEDNAYHTFKFRKTTDYGETWSNTSFDVDVPYYYVEDHIFDDNIFDVYLPSQQFEVVYGTDTVIVDELAGNEDAILDTLNYPGLFIGYDNDVVVDANGGVHFMCLVIPESEESGYIMPTVNEGCGFYHLYCADPASESAVWSVSFVTSMQNTWRFPYGHGDRAWQSFFPAMATSTEDPDVIYAVYPKGNIYKAWSEEDQDTLLYKKSYDIYVRRSVDAGQTWQTEINATNTDGFDEICAHADPDATDDHVYLIYQVPDYATHTVDEDTSDAVPEDYKNRVYFMDVDYSSVVSGIENLVDVPAKFELEQNYPNPFNPMTTINFDIHQAGEYNLEVFNTLGRKVRTLFSEYKGSGHYEIELDGSNMSSGIYFYSLTGDNITVTRKSVLLK